MSTEIEFVKMHGAGNDFIVVNDPDTRIDPSRGTVAALCESHRGIGADGLIILSPSGGTDFSMRYFNSDGGEAEMCGNGARCAALFAYEAGIADRSMTFETRAGIVTADVLADGVRIAISRVHGMRLDVACERAGLTVHFAVSGVPHAVLLTENAATFPKDEFMRIAAAVRHDPAFGSSGVNVNLVTVAGRNRLAYRTFERGVEAETLACGTGAVAASVVCAHLALVEPPVECETSGGDVLVVGFTTTSDGASSCTLQGPAVVSFRGTFQLEDFEDDG